MIKFFAGATLALVLLSVGIGVGYASRNSTGTMSAINGPYSSGTTISSSAVNARLSDIENEISDSKSRSGKGDFTAPIRGANGTVAAPTLSFSNDTGSGIYRIGASDLGFSVNGSLSTEWNATGFGIGAPATTKLTVLSADNVNATNIALLKGNDGTAAIGIGRQDIRAAGSATDQSLFIAPKGAGVISLNSSAGNAVVSVATAGTTFSTGVGADGSGFKHKRGVAGCTTAAAAGATCSVTVTWTTAFTDANYTAVCNLDGSSGPAAYVGINSKIAASVAVVITAVTAVAATATTVECIAVHD